MSRIEGKDRTMNRPVCLAIIAMSLVLTGVCFANSGESLQQENALLRHRIERLENAIEEMKKTSQPSKSAAGAKSAQSSTGAEAKTQNTDVANLQKENEQLKQRITKLEAAINDLKAPKPSPTPAPAVAAAPAPAAPAAAAKKEAPQGGVTPSAAPAPAPTPAVAPVPAPAPAPAPAADQRKNVWSNLDIQLYGYVKLDASYDTSRTTVGNYVAYVDSEATNENDNEFNATVNQTRMGFNITGPVTDELKTTGCIEFDFYGNYASENKAKIQMRLGYLNLDWTQSRFSILAGQAPDVISPLNPYTLNYLVLWDSGNIGYRRPQIRLTQSFALNDQTTLKLEGAAVRTIGRTDPTSSESGEDAGFPTGQGRVSLTFPCFGPKPTTIGVSGHIGGEEYDLNAAGDHENFRTWSGNFDLTQPICPGVTLLGEFFIGEDLDNYFGGIGQGVNTTTRKEIASKGGWAAVSLGPWAQWSFNLGGGVDSANADDLNTGNRTYNSSVFGNVLFAVNKNAQVGMELSQWTTRYKGPGDADDTRAQASFIYKF
jgi:hypothetical protein